MNRNAGMCTCKDLVKKYTLHLYCVFLAIRNCIFLRLNHGIFKSSPFPSLFFGCDHYFGAAPQGIGMPCRCAVEVGR